MTPLETGLVLAAIKPLEESTYAGLKQAFSTQATNFSSESLVRHLSSRAKSISEVKTLLCLEHPVYLTEFYSPQFIMLPANTKRIEVTSPDALSESKRMIVIGVAGQGKSILFRYLALHELARKHLPLYIELRNFEHANSIHELLMSELATLGFPSDEVVLNHLLMCGNSVLYLDAFDEVPPGKQSKARKQIEDLARKYPELRIYLSSRPSIGIESSNFFRVARLDLLKPTEAKGVLQKMCSATDDKQRILNELDLANERITELLTTPLLIALLLLHFRLSGEFPQTEQAFFGDLFDVLLRRHYQTKGYTREKHSNASELDLQHLFGFISFSCRKEGLVELPRETLVVACEAGAKFHGKSYDPAGALDDIVKGTNLILEDGVICRFAHKAIQEFYAARFLAAQSGDNIEKFLANRIRTWDQWEQFLEFMELIHPYAFHKHFSIPHVGWIAFGDPSKRVKPGWKPSKKTFERVFGDDYVGILRQSCVYEKGVLAENMGAYPTTGPGRDARRAQSIATDTAGTIPTTDEIAMRVEAVLDWLRPHLLARARVSGCPTMSGIKGRVTGGWASRPATRMWRRCSERCACCDLAIGAGKRESRNRIFLRWNYSWDCGRA